MDARESTEFNQLMRVFLKLIAFAFCLLCFFLTTLPLLPWLQLDANRVRPLLVRLTSVCARFMVWVLGLKVEVTGRKDLWEQHGGHLIVANHMSYVDVVLLAHLRPACFVTSEEIRRTAGLGWIVQAAGCLFVNRRDRRNLGNEVSELESALREGLDVVVFPEATSTNGEAILRFKRPLFAAAIRAQAPVLPVTINYLSADGVPVGPHNRDALCWYGDMDFLPHFLALARLRSTRLQVHVASALTDYQETHILADAAHRIVSHHFRPLLEVL